MNTISAVKPYACHQCDKRFGRRYNLLRHTENAHAEDESDIDEVEVDNSEPEFKSSRFEDPEMENYETESTYDEEEDLEENDSESVTEVEDDESSDEDESSSDLEDNAAYLDWLGEAKEAIDEMWSEKHEKYINEGIKIMDEIEDRVNHSGILLPTAVSRVISKHQAKFDGLFHQLDEDDVNEEDSDD
ncbi:transcriptional regulator of yeast form adherence 4-like [Patiria miniata]|uniref:C2H2-type domain-containing protein n=1 Tax=Patiria miniata TaxID=46514 RepID=A0A913ZWG9_PATMI|nr:transcriptional regulator of yeast form adherence 4-like [Patiria miniata]